HRRGDWALWSLTLETIANPSMPMPKPPPGHALNVHRAARSLEIFSSRGVWLVALLPPMWGLICGGLTLTASETATIPLTRSSLVQQAPRFLGRVAGSMTMLAAMFTLGALVGSASWSIVLAPVITAAASWVLYFPAFGLFLHRLSRPGSALQQRVSRLTARSTATAVGVLALTTLLPDVLWAMDQAESPMWLLRLGVAWLLVVALTATLPRSWFLLLGDFWGVSGWDGEVSVETIQGVLVDNTGLRVVSESVGLSAEGQRGALEVKVSLDLAHAPGELHITVISPRLAARHPDLILRRRTADESDGVRLPDPILHGSLLVRAQDEARAVALLDTLHADLLSVFHPHEDAHLAAGRLTLRITGPPFADATKSVDVGMFVVDRVEECIGLMAALTERADEAPTMALQDGRIKDGV
ncbi:MAG: hypothetical protein ACI8RZ_001775, partial [Myxococcota bacterium]